MYRNITIIERKGFQTYRDLIDPNIYYLYIYYKFIHIFILEIYVLIYMY